MSGSEQLTFLSVTLLILHSYYIKVFLLAVFFHFISHTVCPPPLLALKDDQGVVKTTNQITGKVGKRGKVTCKGDKWVFWFWCVFVSVFLD